MCSWQAHLHCIKNFLLAACPALQILMDCEGVDAVDQVGALQHAFNKQLLVDSSWAAVDS